MTPTPRAPLLAIAALLAVVSACRCETARAPDAGPDSGTGEARDGGSDASVAPEVDGGLDAGVDAGAPDAGLSEHDYCLALAQARCERERRCGFLDEAQRSTCLGRLEAECLEPFARVRAGAARFDPGAALACVGAARSPPCIEGPRALAPACEVHQLFHAAGVSGSGCVDSQDCVAGFCFGTARQCRTCRPFRTGTESCTAIDLRCDPSSAFCPAGSGARACTALRSDGAACGSSSECATGWCNYRGNVPGEGPDTCGRLAGGARCGDPGDCRPGTWCQGYAFDGVSVTPGVCSLRTPLGQPCSNQPDDDGCLEPGTCLEGRCVVPSAYSLDAGAECEGLTQCGESTFCRGFEAPAPDGGRSLRSGTCSPRLAPGAPCDFTTYVDTDCDDTSTCGLAGTCVPRGSTDAGCQARFECRDFLSCPLSTLRCAPFVPLGEACDEPGLSCVDGATDARCVVNASGTGATCVPLLVDGASCPLLEPGQCASARCFAPDGGSTTCQPACLP